MVNELPPLLSICIPTFNRASFLKIMLQALLPQVRACGPDVEVWVLDNASTDDTQAVLEESKSLGPFQIKTQLVNVGATRNIVAGPTTLAQGQYAWILGDHNLLRPHALSRVLRCLRQHPGYEIFYVNFQAAQYPEQWPEAALEGHDGPYQYLGNPAVADGVVDHWHELISPYSAACTQAYVHIVATKIWQNFWKSKFIEKDYSSATTTYPHTVTILNTHMHSPTVVIADPVITIFNGAQSWNNPSTRAKVYFIGFVGLLTELRRNGLSANRRRMLWKAFFVPQAAGVIHEVCERFGRSQGLLLTINNLGANTRCWLLLASLLPEIIMPRLTNKFRRARDWLKNYRRWYLFNFRPARWIRNIGRKLGGKNRP